MRSVESINLFARMVSTSFRSRLSGGAAGLDDHITDSSGVQFVAQAFQAQATAPLAARFGVAEAYNDKMLDSHGSDRVYLSCATFVARFLMPVSLQLMGASKSFHQLAVPFLGFERKYCSTKSLGSGIKVLTRFGLINVGHEGHNSSLAGHSTGAYPV